MILSLPWVTFLPCLVVVGSIFVEVPLGVVTTVRLTVVEAPVIVQAGVGVMVFGETLEVLPFVKPVRIKDMLGFQYFSVFDYFKDTFIETIPHLVVCKMRIDCRLMIGYRHYRCNNGRCFLLYCCKRSQHTHLFPHKETDTHLGSIPLADYLNFCNIYFLPLLATELREMN